MHVAVLQSSYLPWKGYFDVLHDVDVFVFYDDVQYTRQDWRNRNRIKTPQGSAWLTIPVGSRIDQRICDVRIRNSRWQSKHWKSICQYYRKARYFDLYAEPLERVYAQTWESLSELNQTLIRLVCDWLQLQPEFRDSREFELPQFRNQRLLSLLEQLEANVYVSGPAARSYLDEAAFRAAGVEVRWKDYAGYPEYEQFFPPFDHFVSVLDAVFHLGPDAPHFIWGWRQPHERAASKDCRKKWVSAGVECDTGRDFRRA